jgi:hypothetical protein
MRTEKMMAKMVGYTTHKVKGTIYVNLDLVVKFAPHPSGGTVLQLTDGTSAHVMAEPETIANHANGR